MTNEAAYWEAREAAKEAALKMAAGLSAREKGYLVRTIKNDAINETVHDYTEQRRFEKAFLSIDRPNKDGSTFDYFFRNREVNRIINAIDEPYNAWRRTLRRKRRFMLACEALYGYPQLLETFLAICQFRTRKKIIFALQIKDKAYQMRFSRVTKILKSCLGI